MSRLKLWEYQPKTQLLFQNNKHDIISLKEIQVYLINSFKSFQHILVADIESLDEVEGIGEVRARTIKQSLKRMQEQFIF